MKKNTGESLRGIYGKDLENESDLYADMNKENAEKSALKEEQKKALDAYESKKDGESGNLYDDVNKRYEMEAEQEKVKEAYESNFAVPKKGSEENMENKKNEKLRQLADIEKEKRAAEFKKEEKKRQEKKDFVNSYKQQFGEEKDIINNPKKSGTVASNIDTSVNNTPVDDETKNQKIIRERNKNMPDKIGDELIDNDLEKRAAKILATGEQDAETQRKIINKQDNRNNDLSIENEQLEKFFERANNRLDTMKDELDKQIEEVKNPTLKESIIGFLKKPKVKGAIVFGLAGAAVYAASGGTAVPIYFAVKAALASVGVEIFVPAAVGHGLSTWGTAAVVGGATGEFASYLSKKLGLSKGEKSDKEKHQEGLENLKNIANGQQVNETRQETQNQGNVAANGTAVNETKPGSIGNTAEKPAENKNEVFDVVGIVEFVKMAKKNNLTAQDLLNEFEGKIDRMENVRQLLVPEMKIIALFQKDKDINAAYKWLGGKLEEIKKQKLIYRENAEQSPEVVVEPAKNKVKEEERTNSEVISSEVNEMENLIINFKKGETSGKELLEYVQILEELCKKYGDEEAKPLIGAIQEKTYSFDEKTRGQIVDAMIEHAQEKNMKPSEVLDYVGYFQNIEEMNSKNYKWLMGKEKESAVGEKEPAKPEILEKEVQSPVIKIELNAETTIKMQKKLQELKQELQEKRENIDHYKAPERVNEIMENLRYKIVIVEKLLSHGSVSTHELSREILKKDNGIHGDAFNEACGEMSSFVKNIENVEKATGGKKKIITKIEKMRDPFVEASEKNLEDFIKNSSELQAIIKTVEDSKVSISDLGKMVESWNAKYPGILTGLYVQKEFKGKEKAIKITMDDKGNVWVAGGDPDGLKYLKY